MSSKTDEKLKKILVEQLNTNMNTINDRIFGIFLYGFIVGVIMSYSGFLSYFAGIGTGVLIANKYTFISRQITDNFSYFFQNIINQVLPTKT